ncbi:hypothetical protein IKQ65_02785 [Candidatus Saccharibacteria bacterium]|nr:hypothetical protein [Candidatus Saccharibacteria bacterium]
MEEYNKYTEKIRILAIAAVVFFVSLVFFLYALSQQRNPVLIVNKGSNQTDLLSASELTYVRDELKAFLGASDNIDVSIRWSSFVIQNEHYKRFLVDIDSQQSTYRVSLIGENVYIQCPNAGESKYDNFVCNVEGVDGQNTAYMVLGDILPYQGSVDGVEYSMNTHGGPELFVHIFDCEDEQKKEAVDQDIVNLIKSHRGNPDTIGRVYEYNSCD